MKAILESLPAIIWLIFILFIVISTKKNKAKQKKAAEQKFQQKLEDERKKLEQEQRIEVMTKLLGGKPGQTGNAAKPKNAESAGSGMISRDVQRTAAAKQKQSGMKAVKKAPRGLADTGIHDDKNDWLSQQYAEEKRSERLMSAMFGLKMEHAKNCAAEKIREEHEANCDAEKVRKYSRK